MDYVCMYHEYTFIFKFFEYPYDMKKTTTLAKDDKIIPTCRQHDHKTISHQNQKSVLPIS